MNSIKTGMLALVLATLALGAARGEARAQIYPEPTGFCMLWPLSPNPPVGAVVDLVIAATDRAGARIVGVTAGLEVVEQPGRGAFVTPSQITTGPDGTATVQFHTGDTPGVIRISGLCEDIKVAAQVAVPIGQPPGAPLTGGGPAAPASLWPVIAALALVTASGVKLALRRRA